MPYDSDVVNLPLYATTTRESILTFIDVPCLKGSHSHWISCATSLVIKYMHN